MIEKTMLTKLENIIKRIFQSIETIHPQTIDVSYAGEQYFQSDFYNIQCFQFEKSNAELLHFDLIVPSDNNEVHKIKIKDFMNQIMFKYNVENVACFLHNGRNIETDYTTKFEKNNIFKVTCQGENNTQNTVYIDIDPEEFFS